MAIIFDEVTAEVAPEGGAARPEAAPPAAPGGSVESAELVRREVQLMREREQRLVAD